MLPPLCEPALVQGNPPTSSLARSQSHFPEPLEDVSCGRSGWLWQHATSHLHQPFCTLAQHGSQFQNATGVVRTEGLLEICLSSIHCTSSAGTNPGM